MTTGNTDTDTLLAEPVPLTLVSGRAIKVERLRTRALMSLLKILTSGAAEILPTLSFSADTSQEEFTGQLLGAMIMAIPEAEDEAVEFINRMVSPAGLKTGSRLTPGDMEFNMEAEMGLREELADPDLNDLLTIVSEIIKVEAPHIMALGKQLAVLFRAQQMSTAAKQGASSKNDSAG